SSRSSLPFESPGELRTSAWPLQEGPAHSCLTFTRREERIPFRFETKGGCMPGVMIGSTTISWEWVARASGIVAAALALMGLLIAGSNYPGVNAPTADVTTYYDKSHSKVMLTGLLFAISVTFFFWFIGAVVSTLREAGLGGWAATVLGLGTARGAFLM